MKSALRLQDKKIIVDPPLIRRLFGYGIILHFHFFLIILKKVTEAEQVVHACNASVWEVKAEESGVQDHSVLHSQLRLWTTCDPTQTTTVSQKFSDRWVKSRIEQIAINGVGCW